MNNPIDYWYQKYLQEKKRADNLQSAIEVAEDHAYLAGQEAMMEKLSKLKELADKMYYAAQYLTTDASKLRKAMHDYWHYVVYELKEDKQ